MFKNGILTTFPATAPHRKPLHFLRLLGLYEIACGEWFHSGAGRMPKGRCFTISTPDPRAAHMPITMSIYYTYPPESGVEVRYNGEALTLLIRTPRTDG